MEDTDNIIKRYDIAKRRFFQDGFLIAGQEATKLKIRPDNLKVAEEYLNVKERELRKVYGSGKDATIRNTKTLYKLLTAHMNNILYWFNDKSLKDITEKDIESVYDKLESGELLSVRGKRLSDVSLKDIYQKVFKGGFFRYLGKGDMAKKVILRKFVPPQEVRYFEIDTLKKIVAKTEYPDQKLAWWLLFDTGVEVMALCQLKKSNFELVKDDSGEYYVFRVQKDISKQTRQSRVMHIVHDETYKLLKAHLSTLEQDERLFKFMPHALSKLLDKLNKEHKFKVLPSGDFVSVKDFRSSCASYLLNVKRWTTDEVKARLGHTPSSPQIDRYVNYHGLNIARRREQDIKIDFLHYKQMYEQQAERLKELEENYAKLNKLFMTAMQPNYDRMLDETAGK